MWQGGAPIGDNESWRPIAGQAAGGVCTSRPASIRAGIGPTELGAEAGCPRGKSGKQKAVLAVARRLALLMVALWRGEEEHIPLRNATAARELEGEACDGPQGNGEGNGGGSCSIPETIMVDKVGQGKVRRKRKRR